MGDFPSGFRFYPTEEELISFYLLHKLQGKKEERLHQVIPAIDICGIEPWELPSINLLNLHLNMFAFVTICDVQVVAELAGELCQGDTEQWFFFTPRQEREADGGRPSRTTPSGYWKATGSPGYVYSSSNRVIGLKKTMVFYKGKAPNGRKTKWKMNEYRAIEGAADHPSSTCVPKLRHEFSLCRVYVISGSFRAFDRRPFEAVARETQPGGDKTNATAPSGQDYAGSSETSNSGGYDHGDVAASANWVMVDGLANPWEQLNWLDLI